MAARVLYVIDGDTIGVSVNGVGMRVRYAGIDTPELGDEPEACAQEAQAANAGLVLGKEVRLLWAEEETDPYGRRLAYVFTSSGVFVNAFLLERGLAAALIIPPNTRFAELFSNLESEAKRSSRGIWSESKCRS